MLMQIVASSQGGQTNAQSRNETRPTALWTHSKSGAAVIVPLSSSASASPLDRYHTSLTTSNVRTKLSDGLARHGYYTTMAYIGSPPQAFALIVDTGSTITYVPCSSCSHCGSHEHTKRAGAYCLGLFQNEDSTTILGGIVTRNMLVTYDREKDQIGFVRTKCTDLWRNLSAGALSASDNDSSIPPFSSGDTGWVDSSMPYLSPTRYPGSVPPHQNHTRTYGGDYSDTDDMDPKKSVDLSDASSLSFLLHVSFMTHSLRHFHEPLIIVLVGTLWK